MNARTQARVHAILPWILLGLGVWFAARGWRDANRGDGSDLTVYWNAARAVIEGRDPNTVHEWIYPPGVAIALVPFGLLPLPIAAALFQLASLAAIAWSARRSVKLVRDAGLPAPRWLDWLPALIVLRLADSNLTNGQVNHFTLALIVAALLAEQRGRELVAGAWIGAAAAFKLVPGIVALAFAVRRDARALCGTVVSFVAGFLVLPLVAFGPRHGSDLLLGWWNNLVAPYAIGGETLLAAREYVPGQSLTAILYRALAATPATSRRAAGPTAELVDWSPEAVQHIVRAVQVAMLVALVLTLWRSVREDRPGSRLREVCLCMATGLLVAPLVHKAHMVWMLLPFTLLLAGAPIVMSVFARRTRWTLIGSSVLCIAATAPFLLGRAFASTALSYNFVGIGVLLAWFALAVDVWARPSRN